MKIKKISLRPGEQIQITVNGQKVILVGFEPGRGNDALCVGYQSEYFSYECSEHSVRILEQQQ